MASSYRLRSSSSFQVAIATCEEIDLVSGALSGIFLGREDSELLLDCVFLGVVLNERERTVRLIYSKKTDTSKLTILVNLSILKLANGSHPRFGNCNLEGWKQLTFTASRVSALTLPSLLCSFLSGRVGKDE